MRGWTRGFSAFVTLLAVLAPLWLGPMLLPIEQAVAEANHVCACGMPVGTCGCLACELLEKQAREDGASPCPLLKGECGKGSLALGGFDAPPAILPAPVRLLAPPALARRSPAPPLDLVSLAPPAPPTRPPRLGLVTVRS